MYKKYPYKLKELIVECYQSGKSVKALSREYSISSSSIYRWVKELSTAKKFSEKHNKETIKETYYAKEDKTTKEYVTWIEVKKIFIK